MSTSSKSPSIRELRAARGASKPSFARRFRGFLITGALFVAFILFCFLVLPSLVKARALRELSTRLGREVTIEKIRINPLVLSVAIEGLAVAEVDKSAGDFVGWKRVYVNVDSWHLLRGGIGFSEIAVEGFHAHVAKVKNGGMNVDDVIAKLTAPDPLAPPAAPKNPSAKPPSIFIGKLLVSDARITFDDTSRERPFTSALGPLTFSLENFKTIGDPNSPYHFEAVTGAGEKIAWKGTLSVDPLKSQGELVLSNLDLARLSPYYHHLVKGELRSAFVDAGGKYSLVLKEGLPALTLSEGAFTLRDVRFGAPGVEADAFGLKRLAVTGISADSADLRAAIARVSIEGLKLKAVRDAEGLDLLRLLAPIATPGKTPVVASAGATKPMPSVTLGELSVSGVQVDVTDNTTPRPAQHRIDDIQFWVRDISSANLAKALPFELTVLLPHDGRMHFAGTATPQPLAAAVSMDLANVPFANASPYVEPFLNIRLADGAVRAKGAITFEKESLTYNGDFAIERFSTVDGKLAQEFVKWSELSVSGIRLVSQPRSLAVEEIKLTDPSASVVLERDGTLSIAQAVALPAPGKEPSAKESEVKESAPIVAFVQPAAGAPAASALPPVTIGRVVMQNGAFRFEDRSVQPAARTALTGFSGSITGLSSAAPARADIDIRGKVDGTAPVAITGKLNPLGSPAYTDLKISFKGIDLQPGAGPYVSKFAGYQLSRGNLNVEVDFKLQDRAINSANVVTLDQFYLGARTNSPEATKLPVGLALALLRDSSGKIVIDLPVKGSLDDPDLKISRVVIRVLTNVLVKAATSPFSLLGAAFGGGGDELGYQDFIPGVAVVAEKDLKKLETIAKALAARPALNLDVEGSCDPVSDRTALRAAQLERQIRSATWEASRIVDATTPAPESLEITAELRASAITRLYAVAYPAGVALVAPPSPESAATVAVHAPVAEPTPAPEIKTTAWSRVKRVVEWLPKRLFYPDGPSSLELSAAEAPAAAPAAEGAPAVVDGAHPAPPTTAEMEQQLLAAIVVSDEALLGLADARAQAVRTWLIEQGKVPAERVFLIATTLKGPRVQLNLR